MSKNLITNTNNYSTMKVGNYTIQTLTIDNETYSPVRELLVALGVTSEEKLSSYMNSHVSNYYKNITSGSIDFLYTLKFKFKDGKYYNTDSLNLKDIFKFVQILSPRNKALKDKANRYFFKMEEVALGKIPTIKSIVESKVVRRTFTDRINEFEKLDSFTFRTATDYVYVIAFGMRACDIKNKFNLKINSNTSVKDYLSDECLLHYNAIHSLFAQGKFSNLLELKELKDKIKPLFTPMKVTIREDTKMIVKEERILTNV